MNKITPDNLAAATNILLAGGVAIIPTDTIYGIAAHPGSDSAVARICTIKGRPTSKPIALLAADQESVIQFCGNVSASAQRLMDAFWPGALTLVLPCHNNFEGFRVPDHDKTRELIKTCGGTLRVTSANLSGSMPARSAVEALKDVGLTADLVIDGGISPGSIASTVVKVESDGTLTILRQGSITAKQIHSVS